MKSKLYRSFLGFLTFFAITQGTISCEGAQRADLIEILNIGKGQVVADLGAGDGEWTEEMVRLVGEEGKVFATEVDDEKLEELKEKFASDNVEVLRGSQDETGLPTACCDLILLRLVYHHFENPEVMNRDILRTLKSGGRLVLIDFPPTDRFPRSNVPEFRGGHGVEIERVVQEITEAGLELTQRIDDWDSPQDRYLLVFEKP